MSSDFSHLNFDHYHNGIYSGFQNNFNSNNFYQPIPHYNDNIMYYNLVYQQERSEEYFIQKLQAMFKIANYKEMYKLIESFSFSSKYHPYLQELWYSAHYQEAVTCRQKPLSPVAKYRIRQKYPLPKTIWDGEKTTYCFKESTRKLLKESFEKNPFPSASVKASLAQQTELSVDQISNWFKNCRQRHKTIKKKTSSTNELENNESLNENSIVKTEVFKPENIPLMPSIGSFNYQNLQGEINQIPENNYYGNLPYNYPFDLQYLSYLEYFRNYGNQLHNSFSYSNQNH